MERGSPAGAGSPTEMPWWIAVPFLGFGVAGQVFLWYAITNLADADQQVVGRARWLGPFLPRRAFTATGWKSKVIGLWLHAAAVAVLIVWVLVDIAWTG